jgi:pimeloyl-ACP methyl ester carboxylesterase
MALPSRICQGQVIPYALGKNASGCIYLQGDVRARIAMAKAKSNGIEIEYETLGNRDDPPVLLIIGWGLQLISWPDEFCKLLADQGHYIVRFDNRDIGLSTKIDWGGVPDVFDVFGKTARREVVAVPYLLKDMAADTVGLLDALHIASAHIVGHSLGGMIAQTIAIEYPERIRSLVSIMSTTGRADLPQADQEVFAQIMKMPREREAAIAQSMKLEKLVTGNVFAFEEDRARDIATRSYDRNFYPRGVVRHLAAILASGSRAEALKSVKTPALVIHGNRDPLIHIEGGKDTARSIPGAIFLEIDGLGHYLSRAAWPTIIQAITELIRRVETA